MLVGADDADDLAAAGGRLEELGDVAQSGERGGERARDRRRGERQHVHVAPDSRRRNVQHPDLGRKRFESSNVTKSTVQCQNTSKKV